MHLAFALTFGANLYYISVWFRNHHREYFRFALNAQLSIEPPSERLFWWRKACISTKLTFSYQSAVNNSNFSLGHAHTQRVLIDLTLTLNCFHQETIKWKTHVNTWPGTHGQIQFLVWFMASDTVEINQSPVCVQTKRRLRTRRKGMCEMF